VALFSTAVGVIASQLFNMASTVFCKLQLKYLVKLSAWQTNN